MGSVIAEAEREAYLRKQNLKVNCGRGMGSVIEEAKWEG